MSNSKKSTTNEAVPKSTRKHVINSKDQAKMFDYVNSHLTMMESSYDDRKSLFKSREGAERVSIPEPRYQSSSKSKNANEYVYSSYHDFDCTICMEGIRIGESVRKLKCNHMYHATCLEWFQSDPESGVICPTCEDDLME